MKIVFFAHPLFLGSQSMPRFVSMLAEGMQSHGHEVEIWRPKPLFRNIPLNGLKKWLGYIDQYLVFPQQVKSKIKNNKKDVLYVVTDHALGPYVPLVANLPHVIHCHDFLAQASAKGVYPQNVTSATGIKYQDYIHSGYSKGKNFISVSEKTKADLSVYLDQQPERSNVIYNGLNPAFKPLQIALSRATLGLELQLDLKNGYILHVGGNQWYKNRTGVIAIYDQWRKLSGLSLPLLLIGQKPAAALIQKYEASPYKDDIHFFSGINDESVRLAYAGASVFLFPSIAEGFGWPIAEAMASGTIVVTTNEAPMLEVAGEAAFLISGKPVAKEMEEKWAAEAAMVLDKAINLDESDRNEWLAKGFQQIEKFKLTDALDRIEKIYREVLNDSKQ